MNGFVVADERIEKSKRILDEAFQEAKVPSWENMRSSPFGLIETLKFQYSARLIQIGRYKLAVKLPLVCKVKQE